MGTELIWLRADTYRFICGPCTPANQVDVERGRELCRARFSFCHMSEGFNYTESPVVVLTDHIITQLEMEIVF